VDLEARARVLLARWRALIGRVAFFAVFGLTRFRLVEHFELRPGSVIVDLAAESGGNVELTKPGEQIDVGGVLIVGTRNVPSTMPLHASMLYARNVANLLLHLVKDAAINLDFEDEITKGACVTHDGEIVSERAKQLLAAAS